MVVVLRTLQRPNHHPGYHNPLFDVSQCATRPVSRRLRGCGEVIGLHLDTVADPTEIVVQKRHFLLTKNRVFKTDIFAQNPYLNPI